MGTEHVVFIHGLGDGPDAWTHQVAQLPEGFTGVSLEVPGLGSAGGINTSFSLADASSNIVAELDRLGVDRAHLCGLSLGAMIAFRIAVDHPERVRSLTLAAGQVKPPRVLMAIQNAIMRMLPGKLVAPAGTTKTQMLAILKAVAETDVSDELASVAVPTLVLCGSKDRANISAARAFEAGIPDARIQIIEGAGHQSNTQTPERFSAALNQFLLRDR